MRINRIKSGGTIQSLSFLAILGLVGLSAAGTGGKSDKKTTEYLRYVVFDLGANFVPVGLNDNNVMVGTLTTNGGTFPAFLDLNVMTQPKLLATNLGPVLSKPSVVGIDNAGHIAGNALNESHNSSNYPTYKAGCYWDNTNATPTVLGQGGQGGLGIRVGNGAPYQITVTSISPAGFIVGGSGDPNWALSFNPSWNVGGTNLAHVLPVDGYGQNYDYEVGPSVWATGAAGTNQWCGYGDFYAVTNSWTAPVINGTPFTNYPTLYPYAINASNIVVGGDGSNAVMMLPGSGGTYSTNILGPGVAYFMNDLVTTNIVGTVTNIAATPQVLGYSTKGPTIWDQTAYNGTNTINGKYIGKSFNAMLFQPENTRVTLTAVYGINRYGLIIGTADFTQLDKGKKKGLVTSHGVLLLPCQFALLNGDTNTAHRDGMDFAGNRPTTISATVDYATATLVSNAIGNTNDLGNCALNVLGIDTPLGQGRPVHDNAFYGNCYLASLMVLAKASPSSVPNISYAWYRDYQIRAVTIENTPTNTWYVKAVGYSSGIPTRNPDWTNSLIYGTVTNYQTTAPNPSNNVLAIYDNPGMYIPQYTNNGPNIHGPNTNDYAYQKVKFTYYLTNSIGTASTLVTQNIGAYIVVQKTNTTGIIANDWKGMSNNVSTTIIPDCSGVTKAEIRGIVGGTNMILLDPNVTNNF